MINYSMSNQSMSRQPKFYEETRDKIISTLLNT